MHALIYLNKKNTQAFKKKGTRNEKQREMKNNGNNKETHKPARRAQRDKRKGKDKRKMGETDDEMQHVLRQ